MARWVVVDFPTVEGRMVVFVAGLRYSFAGSQSQPAVSGGNEAAHPPIRQLPLRADTQAIGPAECEERQMEPDVRTGLG